MHRIRNRKKTNRLEKILLSCAVLLVAITLLLYIWPPRVKAQVTVEAGTADLDVADFVNRNGNGASLANLSDLDLAVPGKYDLQIRIGEKLYHSRLNVVDTRPPAAQSADQEIWLGETLAAADFIKQIDDATTVTVTFKQTPDFTRPGEQTVTLVLEDSGHNKTEQTAQLTIARIRSRVQVEAGSAAVDIRAFLKPDEQQAAAFVSDITALDLSQPGIQDVQIDLGGEILTAQLEVVDTMPPTATVKNGKAWLNEALPAENLVQDIIDATAVTVRYKTEPDLATLGVQAITVVLTDAAGNETELPINLTVQADEKAPVIKGVKSQTVFVGATIAYRKGVTVTDNHDKAVDLQVDSGNVNLRKTGTYTVLYSATDSAGNKASKKATILVVEKTDNSIDPAVLDQLADNVLAKIIKAGMTSREKANAIYWWTKGHIGYVNHSDKSSWINAAYQGITTGRGDCFNYFATAKILLTRAGIQNMDIVKLNGGHYWSLVNLGNGWYHFDTTPRKAGGEFFMLTDAEITAYSVKHNNSHVWDHSKYPATPKS